MSGMGIAINRIALGFVECHVSSSHVDWAKNMTEQGKRVPLECSPVVNEQSTSDFLRFMQNFNKEGDGLKW